MVTFGVRQFGSHLFTDLLIAFRFFVRVKFDPDSRIASILASGVRDPHLAWRDGLLASTAEFVLFVDADNHLPVDYIESGLACFDNPNVAVIYSDLERFGAEVGRVSFPNQFDDHLFGNGYWVTQ